jgi:hypothetical protein
LKRGGGVRMVPLDFETAEGEVVSHEPPQEAPNIVGIVIGSTFKGLVAGLIIGLVAQRIQSTAVTVGVGLVVSGLFAYLVTIGSPYLWEIVLPGSVVGVIVGFAAARYRAPISRPTA